MIPLVTDYTEDPKEIGKRIVNKAMMEGYLSEVDHFDALLATDILYETMEGFLSAGYNWHAEQVRLKIEEVTLNGLGL